MNIKKILKNRWIIRSILPSIYLNFRVLPFKQALKIPILIYKPSFRNIRGNFKIHAPISFGMIKLGKPSVSIFPNSGISLENLGTIIFLGRVTIGNDSYVSVGSSGLLELGDKVEVTCSLKLICYHKVTIENNVLIGWNNLICDTDFHNPTYTLEKINDEGGNIGFGKIKIGSGSWLANGCKIYKNVEIPAFSIIGADTIIHKIVATDTHTLICNNQEVSIKKRNIYLDLKESKVNYPPFRP